VNNLLSVLQTHLGATFSPVHAVKKSCCSSSFQVIEFDDVKDNFCTAFSIPNHAKLCSADCLHIDPVKRIICFIEMKSAARFISEAQRTYSTYSEFEAALDEWVKSKASSLRLKISDSIFLITAALGKYAPCATDISDILNKADVKIKYVALLDITEKEFIDYNLITLANKVSHGLLSGITCRASIIPATDFDDYVTRNL
jgi:hypothetical protein